MGKSEELRQLMAQFMEVSEDRLVPSFPLIGPRLQGSIGRYSLDSAIRRKLGIKSALVYSATTYGELEAGVLGLELPARQPQIAEAKAKPAANLPASATSHAALSCGIDIELVENLPKVNDYWASEFYANAFTHTEIAYCSMQEDPRLHFAGRWCVKEALRKCDPAFMQVDLDSIEVDRSAGGAIAIIHHHEGTARRLPYAVSMSHTSLMATAMVVKLENSLC